MTKLYFTYFFTFAFWGTIVCLSFISFVPNSPISIDRSWQRNVTILLPQGWNFFTKNPREPYVFLLQKTNFEYKIHKFLPNSNPNNLWGLSRKSRALGLELGIIMNELPKEVWRNSTGENIIQVLNKDTTFTIELKSPFRSQIICGEVALVELEPLPWAWSGSRNLFSMPARYIKLNVLCGNN